MNLREKFKTEENAVSFAMRSQSMEVVTFAEKEEAWVELVKKGTFYWCGETIVIGEQQFAEAIKNFEAGLTNGGKKKDLLFDYEHDTFNTKAAGWIEALKISEDGETLLGKVKWSKAGRESIESDEYRFTSLEFSTFYYALEIVDGEPQEVDKGFTVFACTLTNRPFVKGMGQVTLSENKNIDHLSNMKQNSNNEVEEGMEFKEKFEELTTKFSDLEGKHKESVEALEVVTAERDELKKEVELAKVNVKFNEMMANGQVVEAQREAYIAGDMVKFAETAVVLPREEKGTSEEGVVEKVDIVKEAEKLVEEKNISFSDAMKLVNKNLKEEV